MKEIDGSCLEGGGQILRNALILSTIKRSPIRIIKIRHGRSKPGLMEQHLKGLELIGQMCNAAIKGAELGSTEIEYTPNEIHGGEYSAKVKTAGSISLLLQVALPCALLAKEKTRLSLFGGTNTEMAPQVDYFTEVFRPILEKFGGSFDFKLVKRGYFPKGGGQVVVDISPVVRFNPVQLISRGEVRSIYGWSFVAGTLPLRLAQEMSEAASKTLSDHKQIDIEVYKEDRQIAPDNCSGIILVAETSTDCFLGSSALGKRSEAPHETGIRAGKDLKHCLDKGDCIDTYAQDQVIIFMALAEGLSKIRVSQITMHTKTAMFIVETLTKVKFKVSEEKDGMFIIECEGGI